MWTLCVRVEPVLVPYKGKRGQDNLSDRIVKLIGFEDD